jgi:hypothetical protein
MTVNSSTITSGPFPGNGTSDTFSYTFRVDDKSQLAVFETDDLGAQTTLIVDTDYTVNGVGNDAGGTITRLAGNLPTNFSWYIRSDYKLTQLIAFASQGGFFPDVHESAIDKLTYLILQLSDTGDDRAFRLSNSIPVDGTFDLAENAAARADKFLGFDSSGNLVSSTASASGVGEAPVDGNQYARIDAAWQQIMADPANSFALDSAQTGTLIAFNIWLADVSSSTKTRALPASPNDGDEVIIIDAKNNAVINKITIGRNGNTIGGAAFDYILDQNQKTVHLRYDLANTNWEIIGGGTPTFRDGVFAQSGADVNPDNGLVQIITLTGNLTSTYTNLLTGHWVLQKIVPGAFTWTHSNIAKWTGDGAAPTVIAAEHWVVVTNVDGTIVGTDLKGVS